jgi:hypothetical protein
MKKVIPVLLILALCLPFMFACGESGGGTADTPPPVTDAPAETPTDPPPTEPPEPTEPPTERPTEPPTEPPTDPAELPAPDVMTIGDSEMQIIPGARYYLWSPNSNLYLTAIGGRFAELIQDDFTGTAAQMFVFEPVRVEETETRVTHLYRIRALGTPAGYVDLDGGVSDSDGTSVIITAEPEGEGSHEWTLRPQRKAGFDDIDLPIFSVNSGVARGRVLDVSGVSTSPGGTVHLWGGGAANNQKWFFELVSDVEAGNIIPRGEQDIPFE